MFGIASWTPEMFERIAERDRERSRRMDALIAAGKSRAEAYVSASCQMEWEERDAIEQAKLADIRENGT